MSGYENGDLSTHSVAVDYTSIAAVTIPQMQGKTGTIREVRFVASTACACDTTPNRIQVGDGTDVDAYADISLADGATGDSRHVDSRYIDHANETSGNGILNPVLDFESSKTLVVTPVAGTDASAVAGAGTVTLLISWWG